MFRLFGSEGSKELRELSIKQREQLVEYQREKVAKEWPPLPVVTPTPRNSPTIKG